jgi:hypothetical protein
VHVAEGLRTKRAIPESEYRSLETKKKNTENRAAPDQELLMVLLRQEYLSDGGEEGCPWLH